MIDFKTVVRTAVVEYAVLGQIVLVMVVVLLVAGCYSNSGVAAATLIGDYTRDGSAAIERYGGRSLMVTGNVLKVEHERGSFVVLNGDGSRGIFGSLWRYSSTPTAAATISRLGQYDEVELEGSVVGFEDAERLILRVEDCEVLKIVRAGITILGTN